MCRRVKFSLISVVLTKGGALRNPAFGLQARVISRLYIYMYVGTDDEDATEFAYVGCAYACVAIENQAQIKPVQKEPLSA